ncbi:MAG: hypothetical protein ACMG6S_23990, partial [Byssovorax sp.]
AQIAMYPAWLGLEYVEFEGRFLASLGRRTAVHRLLRKLEGWVKFVDFALIHIRRSQSGAAAPVLLPEFNEFKDLWNEYMAWSP